MKIAESWGLFALSAAVGACSGGDGRPPPAEPTDSGPIRGSGDAGSQEGGLRDGAPPPPTCFPPSPPFGADPDFDVALPDLEVTRCDGSRTNLGEFRCQADATLFSIGAGWCAPCITETSTLQEVFDETRGERIAVVQILFDGADQSGAAASTATTLFCQNWVADVADNWPTIDTLSLPVVIEPLKKSLDFFESAVAPLNVIVDRNGKVRWARSAAIPDKSILLQELRDVASGGP